VTEPGSSPAADSAVRELLHLTPRLRDDLSFHSDDQSGEPCYVIEDRIRSKFYRVGLPEHHFICLLDGTTSVEQALSANAVAYGPQALDIQDAAVIVNWLIQSELAQPESGHQSRHILDKIKQRDRQKWFKRLNLIFIKVPLLNPDRILSTTLPFFRWMLSPIFVAVWLVLISSALYLVFANWNQFISSALGIFSVSNTFWLLSIWIVLKFIHEFFHGLACKKYGGDVYEAGVIMILFAPIGYVDATSAWRFPSRWQRVYTSFAGMYIEFLIASVASWVWVLSEPGLTQHLAYNVIIIASINALLFNANPLMKFDGYYILSDLLKIPNLYGEGQAWIRGQARRWMLGLSPSVTRGSVVTRTIIAVYGLMSFVWRSVLVITLLFIAAGLFKGAGLLIALLSAGVILGVPVFKFVKFLFRGDTRDKPSLLYFVSAMSLLLILGGTVMTRLNWVTSLSAPGIVDFLNLKTVYAESSGFVRRVNTRNQQQLHKGEVLLELENTELASALHEAELELQKLSLQRRAYLLNRLIAESQAMQRKIDSAIALRDDLQRKQDLLVLRAPLDGEVVSSRNESLMGQFIKDGQYIMQLATEPTLEFRILLPQTDADEYRRYLGQAVSVHINGRGQQSFNGMLQRIEPAASHRIRYPALTAMGGGTLAVMAGSNVDTEQNILTHPYFEAVVTLDGNSGLYAGETGEIWISAPARPLGEVWYESVNHWVDKLLGQPVSS